MITKKEKEIKNIDVEEEKMDRIRTSARVNVQEWKAWRVGREKSEGKRERRYKAKEIETDK